MGLLKELKKEAGRSFEDKGFVIFLVLTMLLTPLVVMGVMGSTFQEVVNDLDVIIIDENSSEYSGELIASINDSEYFNIVSFNGTLDEAKLRVGRDVVAVFHIPENFENRLNSAEKGEISLYLDSSDFIIFNFVDGKSRDILEDSVRGIIKIIVEDLETEKLSKESVNTEVKGLVDSLDLEIGGIGRDLGGINIGSLMSELDSLDGKVDTLGDSCEECSVSTISTQIASIKSDLNIYKNTISDAEASVEDSRVIGANIKTKIDDLKLDLRTLKNEFLSRPLDVDKQYVFGDTSYFRYLLPAIISASLFFIVFTLTVVNRIRKKKSRLKNLTKFNILAIKSFFYIILGSLELIYILILTKFVFNVGVSISSLPVFLVLMLLAISSVGLGLVFSFIFRTERQMILLTPLIIIPLVIVSETFSSLKILPSIVGYFAYVSPMYYSNLALREIMLKGSDLYDLLVPLGALITYSIFSIAIGLVIFFFRKK